MRLTIGFDATAALHQSAGIGRYTRHLLGALAEQDEANSYRVFYFSGAERRAALPALNGHFRVRAIPLSDRVANAIWYRLRLPVPVQLATGSIDVFHSPDFTVPPTLGRPTVLTIHDLAFLTRPECAYPTLRTYLEAVVPRSVRRSTHVIAVSNSTRNDLISLLDVPPEKVSTVLEAAGPGFVPGDDPDGDWTLVSRLGIRSRYVLSVGTLEPRKNYVRLLEAYSLLRARGRTELLVIAGTRGWMYEPIFRRIRELRLGDHVILVTPSDPELVALYRRAEVFVYPSVYEGFGMPALEAIACGAPVACSDVSALPEVVGDAAVTFDPFLPEAIADALERILLDSALRAELSRRGPRQASKFSWSRAAAQTLRIYQDVARGA
jgi:glycosyltransferase involved in cell wall biosynthesis